MARTLMVRIVGDSSDAERALQRTANAASGMNAQLAETDKLFRVRAGRGASVGLLRLAGVGVAAGVGIAAATKAVSRLGSELETTGNEAGTFSGKMRNVAASLLRGDIVGVIDAINQKTRDWSEANVLLVASQKDVIEQIKKFGGAAELAAGAIQAMQEAAATPIGLQLREARAALRPGRRDDLAALNAQIAQTFQAVKDINKLRGLAMDENAADAALLEVLRKRKTLEDRRDALLKERKRDPWGAFTKGMALKAEKARLTTALKDDIAATDELIRAIQREIRKEGKTYDLMDQLTQARLARQALVQERAARAEAAAEAQLAAAERRREEARERARRAAERAREAAETRRRQRLARQFEALGLTAGGERPVAGVAALRRRRLSLLEQIKGTVLDTPRTRAQLDRIGQVLSGRFGKLGRDVRQAILDMLNTISDALEGKGAKQGPLTKTTGIRTRQIVAGLGLTPEQERELRARLSGFSTAGRGFAAPPQATRGGFAGAQQPVVVESHVTVEIDGQKVATGVTRSQQKARRRNPRQKRGPARHGS